MKTHSALHFGGRQGGSPVLALLPGGPGCSSRGFARLAAALGARPRVLVDPPGTGEASRPDRFDYGALLADIESALGSVGRPLVLIGHSFGGIQAADLTVRGHLPVRGLVCLATPFSTDSLQAMGRQHERHRTPEAIEREKAYAANPCRETFQAMNLSYLNFYFSKGHESEGRALLEADPFSWEAYRDATAEGIGKAEELGTAVAEWNGPKLFVAGREDLLLPWEALEQDATRGGFAFHLVDGGHFLMFEKPGDTAKVIEEWLAGHASPSP